QARYGRAWRRKAPVEALMPLRLARIGVPLAQTAPEGLVAAGIEPVLLPPAAPAAPALEAAAPEAAEVLVPRQAAPAPAPAPAAASAAAAAAVPPVTHAPPPFAVDPTAMPAAHDSAWFAGPMAPQAAYEGGYNPQYVEGLEPTPVLPPAGPEDAQDSDPEDLVEQVPARKPSQALLPDEEADGSGADLDEVKFAEAAYEVFRTYIEENGKVPSPEQVDIYLSDRHGIAHPRSFSTISRLMPDLKQRYQRDLENEHIA
ncbi:hypothetical protein ACFXB4_39880, partial [Streptomyces lavendulae]